MLRKIIKYLIIVILLIVTIFLIWFKFFLSEFDEFKNVTFFEHSKHLSTDGTYILYKKDSVRLISVAKKKEDYIIIDNQIAKSDFNRKIRINIYNYEKPSNFSFEVELFDTITNPKSDYKETEKILAISDIEGNFYAFYKLLKANNVIDENCNWTFDKGHLVLVGDFVDRGLNVTQVLWLIYKLEKQAKQYGGLVHFINGNHELMNLSGRVYHVRSKYKLLVNELGLNYSSDLYGHNSELGKWLRSKNVIEKIGNNLFVHGGISSQITSLKLSLNTINHVSRKYYGISDFEIKKDSLAKLLYSNLGPFWYRGYIRNIPDNIESEIKNIKDLYSVKRIVIGHSTTKKIMGKYNNSVFDIDVHFPHNNEEIDRGEGILIIGDLIYKVNDLGIKTRIK